MPDRVVEHHWGNVKSAAMDARIDALRKRADWLAEKIGRSPVGSRRHDEREYAALMWAISELTGVAAQVRQERSQQAAVKMGTTRQAEKRAAEAEALNIKYRVRIDALKAELHACYEGRRTFPAVAAPVE